MPELDDARSLEEISAANLASDDFAMVFSGSRNRVVRVPASDLGDTVDFTDVQAALDGEVLEVAGVTLTDTTGTSLAVGTLGLNAAGDVVVHDNESNAEDLPSLVDSQKFSRFFVQLTSVQMDDQTRVAELVSVPLSGVQATIAKKLSITGTIHAKWSSGNKPDGGVFFCLTAEGEDPDGFGFQAPFATATTNEVTQFDIRLELTDAGGGAWQITNTTDAAAALVTKNAAGTVTHVATWTEGVEWATLTNPTGTSAQPNYLVFSVLTSDASATVTASLQVSGFLSVIVQ